MSCDDSCSYALQSLLNAPCAKASDGAEQCRLLSDNRVDFIQRELSVLPPHKGWGGGRAANWRRYGEELRTCIQGLG